MSATRSAPRSTAPVVPLAWDATTGVRRSLAHAGAVAAWVTAALTVAWVVLLTVAPEAPEGTSLAARLRFVDEHDAWQVVSFAPVLPLAALYVVVWLGLAALLWRSHPAAGALGVAFGLLYAPFTTWAYWSQLTVVRGLAELSATSPAQAEHAARVMGFTGDRWSASYAAAVLG